MIMYPPNKTPHHFLLLLSGFLLSYLCFPASGTNNTSNIKCISQEKEALLEFKHGILVDHCGLLSSWGDHEDCCQWRGIHCNNHTSHVIMLDLSGNGYCLEGKMSSSLTELKHLTYLDLSYNKIRSSIPSNFGQMHFLTYLDLSSNELGGTIPISFQNISSLSHLDLSANELEGPFPSIFENMQSLSYLDLSGNRFEGSISDSESISNLKHLAHLDLSWNNFKGSPPKSMGNLCSLRFLELSYNNFTDELSNIIQTLSRCANKGLVFMSLTKNHVWGSVPDIISTFSSLRELYLDYNQLNGSISQSIGQLSMLEGLYLSSNSLQGSLSCRHLVNLSRLQDLDLSNNPALVINITANWIPPFQLDNIQLSVCKLGPYFPEWLLTQSNYSWLDISNTGISDHVPGSFWKSLPSSLLHLNLSQNMMHGVLPDVSVNFLNFPNIDLSLNKFEGAIPSFGGNISSLLLNDNMFSDPMPFLCPRTKIVLSNLDISNNLLLRKFPDCWMNFEQLSVLHLENNHLWGKLPASIGSLDQLMALHLRNNSLSGELPSSLGNCTSLVIVDLSYNSLTGHVPQGIGRNLQTLGIFSLRSNNFFGTLPTSLCHLSHLQILDLSINQIFGSIPMCIHNLTAMRSSKNMLTSIFSQDSNGFFSYYDVEWVMWKRKEQSFRNSLSEVKSIDISNNKLGGKIPDGITSLHGLVFLNLSTNNLSGSIASKIGELTSLQFLDLSNNHLFGKIPISLAGLSSLEILDLSNNNLSGKIPTGTQLQSFDASSYSGNPRLCGPPLPNCPEDQVPTSPLNGHNMAPNDESDNDDIFLGLCISVALGFIVGFWGVCGTLVLKKSWRQAFFRFVDDTKDKIYVTIARAARNIDV